MRRLLISILLLSLAPAFVEAADLVYSHSFKVPALAGIQYRQLTFNNSLGPPAYRPEADTLIVRGHGSFADCADITIPATNGAVATVRGWFDPSQGLDDALTAAKPGTQGFNLRALVIDEVDQSYGLMCEFYNVTAANLNPFFRSDLTLGGYSGPWNGGQHSLRFAEYIAPLPYDLRAKYRVRWGGGNSSPQGNGTSNQGPSLYAFDWPEKSFPANGVFASQPVIQFINGAHHPGWYPSSLIRSMLCFPDEIWWIGRKGTGDNWYGDGQNYLLPDGRRANDAVYTTYKGYHSTNYVPWAWRCKVSTIVAGQPVITEQDLSAYNLTIGKGSELSATQDARGRRVFILDPKSDGDRPMIRVFGVK